MNKSKIPALFQSYMSWLAPVAILVLCLNCVAEEDINVAANGADSGTPLQIFAPDSPANSSNIDYKELPGSRDLNPTLPVFRASTVAVYNADRMLHRDSRVGIGHGGGQLWQWYGIEYFRYDDHAQWLNFTSERVIGSFDYRLGPQWVTSNTFGQANIKLHDFFGKEYLTERKIGLYRNKLIYTPIPDTEVRGEISNDFSYLGWVNDLGQDRLMALQTYFFEVESFSVRGWQLRTNVRETVFDDKNHQRSYDNLILREVIDAPVHLKLGVSGGWTEFSDQLRNYWSPKHFDAYGLRAIASKEITADWWAEAKYYYGFHQERNLPQGRDTATELTLQYRNPRGVLAKLLVNYYDSDGGGWWRNDVGFNLEIPY